MLALASMLKCLCVYDDQSEIFYPHISILGAGMGQNPSYVWRSLTEAMEVVKAGTRPKIGNGVDTKVWHIPSLPDVSGGC